MNNYYPFVNTPLPYAYDALEPYIDKETMHLHHDRHLQAYIDSLNHILSENPALQKYSLEELLTLWRRLPCHLQAPIRNNAGGVYNHRFYFESMKPSPSAGCSRENTAALRSDACFSEKETVSSFRLFQEMSRQFGSPEKFKTLFKEAALSVFGSGYAWLVSDGGRLKVVTSQNQNTPVFHSGTRILNIDVWEHAYYLKHYNLRAAYIDDWIQVVNWEKAGERFSSGLPDGRCK